MTYKTKGILLRTVKYGETSIVATIFTELFGVQTYMVNNVRTSKKNSNKAAYFQPASIVEMIVYHNELKSMQRIKEIKWSFLYQNILSRVIKNSIALYMVELLYKCLKQPEKNTDLFLFCEDAFMQLDKCNKIVTGNFSLYFALQLMHFFGLKMNDNYNERLNILDLQEGNFVAHKPMHHNFIEAEFAQLTSQLLRVMQPDELESFKLNQEIRRKLLMYYRDYYALHIQDFGKMKTLLTLQEVL